jgi:two-component system osmolarity sensor histidine kinase EnvZ
MLKRILPKGLLGRSLLIIVTPLVLVQVISTWVFYDRHWDNITRRLASALVGDVATVIHHLGAFPEPEQKAWIFRVAHTNMGLRSTMKQGETLSAAAASKGNGFLEQVLFDSFRDTVGRPVAIDTGFFARDIVIDVQLPDGVLNIVTSRKRLFSATTYIFIIWSVGSMLVLFVVATIFMRNQIQPIRRLALAADSFGKGRDVPDFKVAGATEVRQAANAFLRMRDRLQRQIGQRTRMLAGVSHDLRTPLTRMKLQLAMLEGTAGIEELRADVAEMEGMVDEYLAFARGEGTETPVETDLSLLLESVVAGARRNGASIELETNGKMVVPVRPHAFKRCIGNIVNNAAYYGDNVSVAASRHGHLIEIYVDDDGPGIPDDMREEVFRPFARLDQSRNPATGGVGLGLTIARDIAHGHGGEIGLGTGPLGGLRATLTLPV